MNRVIILSIAFLFCSDFLNAKANSQKELVKDSVPTAQFDYVVFGFFNVEELPNIYYKYEKLGNKETLMIDTTGEYVANANIGGFVLISDTSKLKYVRKILAQIPDRFLASSAKEQHFECKKCYPAGTSFLFFKQNGTLKKIFFDTNISKVEPQLEYFVKFFHSCLRDMTRYSSYR